jgi:hypothetical protein
MTTEEFLKLDNETSVYVKKDDFYYKYNFRIESIDYENLKGEIEKSYYGTVIEYFESGSAKVGQMSIDKITEDTVYLYTYFLGERLDAEILIESLTTKKIN